MRSLVVIFSVASCVVFGGSLAHADDPFALPPLATFGDQYSGRGTYTLDLKSDRTYSTANAQGGLPVIKKEERIPFIGLSLTRPLDFKK